MRAHAIVPRTRRFYGPRPSRCSPRCSPRCGFGLVLLDANLDPKISTESATALLWWRFYSRTPCLVRWNLRWSATVPFPATAVVVSLSMTTVLPGATALLGTTAAAAWLPATAVTAHCGYGAQRASRERCEVAPAGRDATPLLGVPWVPLMQLSHVASRSSMPLRVSRDCGWNSRDCGRFSSCVGDAAAAGMDAVLILLLAPVVYVNLRCWRAGRFWRCWPLLLVLVRLLPLAAGRCWRCRR